MPLLIIVFIWFLSAPVRAEQMLTVNSHWPPWRVLQDDGQLSGIEIDILKRLSERLQLPLVTKGCGWKRCLKHMELGGSDVMTGLFKTAEREKYIKFISPPYRLEQKTCFYQSRKSSEQINSFADLHKITVGVVEKVVYFEPFDSDDAIKKHYATTDLNLFRLLEANRIDAVAMSCATGDVRLKRLGLSDKFKHARYVHSVAHPVYLGISRKSPLLARQEEISQALQNMVNKGEIKQIMSDYGIVEQ